MYLEDLKFATWETHSDSRPQVFIDRLREDLRKEDAGYLEKQIQGFKSNKIDSSMLFDSFVEVFGLVDVTTTG